MTTKKSFLIILLNLIVFFYSAYNNISINLGEKTFHQLKFFFIDSVYKVKVNYLNFKDYFADINFLKKKVKLLEKENNLLKVKLNSLKEKSTNSFRINFISANVIASSFSGDENSIFIDAGINNGVYEGEGVVSKNGIVGIVVRSFYFYSKVLLLTDIRFSVDIIISDQNLKGLLTGKGNGLCKIKYLPINAQIKIGDKVITSNFSGIFPLGYPVGEIIDVKKNNLYKICIVKPNIQINSLKEVYVIKK